MKERRKIIRGWICLGSLVVISCGVLNQNNKFRNNRGDFGSLIEKHKLYNVKSGLLFTGLKSDTLCVIQYFKEHNNIEVIPIAKLGDKKTKFTQNGTDYYEQERGVLVSGHKGLLVLDSDTIYVIEQNMVCPDHNRVSNYADVKIDSLGRKFYYSKSKGLYKVDYYDDQLEECMEMTWFYKEGDFFNHIWVKI
ncbi:hypothetical protein [Fulvivirga sediminis]|uniref:Lipoprotein n=1 Tax=Fulvivirga sediminis TaxID=2803949 RepID=A0A937F7X2_9BACT|nr:hypothetical protein [Fulvivirga sediminis]MBL3656662.1 hypothetical protein [Fulvivirga sediminis]